MTIDNNNFYLITALSGFYLIVFSTYLSFLFTCSIDNEIKNNQLIILIIGYFLFFYLVTLTDKNNLIEHPIEKMLITLFYYIIFLLTTRLDIKITLWVIIIIFVINFLEINKEHYNLLLQKKVEKENIYWITLKKPFEINLFKVNQAQLNALNTIQTFLYYSLFILIAVGFISFYGELKYLKGDKKISIFKLLFDRNICNLREDRTVYKNLLHAFNIIRNNK